METSEGKKRLDQLEVGEKVLTADANKKLFFSDFFAALDKGTSKVHFYQLVTSAGHVLELSHHHIVFTKKHPNGVKAGDVSVNDQVWVTSNDQLILANVTKVAVVEKEGWYNPGTIEGTVIVNGVWASSYANELASHRQIHNAFAPLRFIYRMGGWLASLYRSPATQGSWDQGEGKHWYVLMMRHLQGFITKIA